MSLYGQHFFWDGQRKNILAFGTLFQGIVVVRRDSAGVEVNRQRVPLSYGPKEKWVHRTKQDEDFLNPLNTVLPRVSYELKGYQYDPNRMHAPTGRVIGEHDKTLGTAKLMYQAVPYNLDFSVYVMTKTLDDGYQIIEQILPFFTPDVTLSINALSPIPQSIDVSITMNSIFHQNTWDGNFETPRELTWLLDFKMKSYFFGPVRDSKIILDQLVTVNAGDSEFFETDQANHIGTEIIDDTALDPTAAD